MIRDDEWVRRCIKLLEQAVEMHGKIERLTAAIRTTASEGTYDEMAIRKVVSFELAELIVEARAALEPISNHEQA